MSRKPLVLIVEDDADSLRVLKTMLSNGGNFDVETSHGGPAAVAVATGIKPDLIISDFAMASMDGIELCKALRETPEGRGVYFVLLTGHTDTQLKVRALDAGVDDFISKPVAMPELLAKARAALRIKRLHDELRDDKAELEQLHRATSESFEQTINVLSHLVELHTPGAADRTQRLVDAVREMIPRVEIPDYDQRDLELAARVYEIGKLADVDDHRDTRAFVASAPAKNGHYALVSATIIERIPQLRKASAIVRALYENYDGTGRPEFWRQAEIPLTSRLLRVLVDFFADLDRKGSEAALESIEHRSNTWYDPAIVAHLGALVHGAPVDNWRSTGARIPVSALSVGMVLAEDLVTDMGLKLVSANTHINGAVLEFILKRHEQEPFMRGAVIVPQMTPSLFPTSSNPPK